MTLNSLLLVLFLAHMFSHASKNLKGGFKLSRSAFDRWLDPLTSYPSSPSPK